MKTEAMEISSELLHKYDLLSVKAAFMLRELIKEIKRLEDINRFYTLESEKYTRVADNH